MLLVFQVLQALQVGQEHLEDMVIAIFLVGLPAINLRAQVEMVVMVAMAVMVVMVVTVREVRFTIAEH